MLIGETFYYTGEALCALEVMKQSGLPSVVTIAPMGENIMRDGLSPVEACKRLEEKGADVVGMNCFRGPATMMPKGTVPFLRNRRSYFINHNGCTKQDRI
jgi:betaine-homocysteine S-methyltransferase